MSGLAIPPQSEAGRVERQAERASFFTHTALSDAAQRQQVTDSLLLGMLDVLLAKGVVSEDEVANAAEAARQRLEEAGETSGPGLAVRVDSDELTETKLVDCKDRWEVCHGICCRLRFALTLPEVESGRIRWDLGQPYLIRQEPDGACTHQDRGSGACTIYEDRPGICRHYSCADDERIWTDFEGRILNQEWIDATLQGYSTPVAITPRRLMEDKVR